MHDVLKQDRLNFLKKKFFNYKVGSSESIDDVSSNLIRLQMIIRDIKSTETLIDLNVVFILINSVDDEVYILAKYHFEKMEKLILAHTKERLKFVKQRIKDDQAIEESANKAEFRKKDDRKCFFCDKTDHIKVKCFK